VRYPPEPNTSNTSGWFYSYITLLDHQGVSQLKQDLKEKLVAIFFPKWRYGKLPTGKFHKTCSLGLNRCVSFTKLWRHENVGRTDRRDGACSLVCVPVFELKIHSPNVMA
jgi:hypothetical protein